MDRTKLIGAFASLNEAKKHSLSEASEYLAEENSKVVIWEQKENKIISGYTYDLHMKKEISFFLTD